MTRPGLEVEVEISGPIFKHGSRIAREAMEDAVQELVELGEQRLDELLQPRNQSSLGVFLSTTEARVGMASQGHYLRNVFAKAEGLKGRINDGKVVYGPWLESGENRRSTQFRGYGSFRKTKQWLDGQSKEVLQKNIRKAVRRMSGP